MITDYSLCVGSCSLKCYTIHTIPRPHQSPILLAKGDPFLLCGPKHYSEIIGKIRLTSSKSSLKCCILSKFEFRPYVSYIGYPFWAQRGIAYSASHEVKDLLGVVAKALIKGSSEKKRGSILCSSISHRTFV